MWIAVRYAVGVNYADDKIVIVVPLDHERRVMQRFLRSENDSLPATIVCCGPGARGVQRLAEQPGVVGEASCIILAGLAGALTRRCAVSSAHWIGRIVDEDGGTLTPTFLPRLAAGASHKLPTLATISQTCVEPEAKRKLAERTGADLVDLEAAYLARLANEWGKSWGVVRGVSDGPDDALPHDVDGWVDAQGRTRLGTVLGALLRRPQTIGAMVKLRRNSIDALRSVQWRLRDVFIR